MSMTALLQCRLLLAVAAVFVGLLAKATAYSGAPALAWSPDAQLLGGQKGRYLDGLGPKGGMQALLGALEEKQKPESVEASPFTFVVVSEKLSRPEFLAPSLEWLASAFKSAPSSVQVNGIEASDVDTLSLPGVSLYQGDIIAQEDALLLQFARKDPDSTTVIIKVASLADESTAAVLKRMVAAVGAAHAGHVVFVVASESPGPTMDLDAVLSSSASGHSSRRRILSSLEAGAPIKIPYAVRNTPSIMAGTIVGFFLLFILSIAVSCLSGIDSAPMMMQQPPGPKEGDPQFNGTPREGTRYYPYRNQPFKEH